MGTYERALELIQNTMSSLYRVGLVDQEILATGDTVLLGSGSLLDSIAFVTFVTDLEERLSRETNKEVYLVLNAIHEFNADSMVLSVDSVARYLVELTNEQAG